MRICIMGLVVLLSTTSAMARARISIDRPRATTLYEQAHARFRAQADLARLRPTLERLSTPVGAKALTPEELVQLKAARKAGAVMSSLFVSLDRRHAPPRRLHDYVHTFGKLNDALEAGVPDVAAREARALLRTLSNKGVKKILASTAKFEPTSRHSFDANVGSLIDDIEARLRQPSLPVEEFHAARKDLKVLMNVAEVMQTAQPQSKEAYRFLVKLNDELGVIHDDVVHRSLHGEISYDDAVVDVPAPLREQALAFLSKI